ncbi:hypothetical protein CAter10_1036 [Collimonas arenae]|nr:hypothetical protein CAter10_1036 [Collimonas arenae]
MYAHLRNDPSLLEEADRLLENIASAWRELEGRTKQSAAAVNSPGNLSLRG